MTRVLIVDDDYSVRNFLDKFLSLEGYAVTVAEDGEAMHRAMATTEFDLVIVDLVLPGEDGLSLVRTLRAQSNIPVIMLTGKQDPVDKVVGLEMGADDYITKPFDNRELLARIRSVLRRSRSRGSSGAAPRAPAIDDRVARFGGWRMVFSARELTDPSGEIVHLTTHEFDLLAALVGRAKRAVTRDQLLDIIADREWDPLNRSIDVMVGKVRRKLEDDAKTPGMIKTIRGVGYMFVASVDYE